MLKYEEFKDILISRIKEYLPAECQDIACEYGYAYEANSIAEEFLVKSENEDILTSLNVENMYRKYLDIKDTDKTLEAIADMIVSLKDKKIKLTIENISENVVYQLINAKQNEHLLKKLPHRKFLDLAIVYKLVSFDEKGMNWRWITNENMECLNIDEQQLYKWANTNTSKLFHVFVKPLSEIVRECMAQMMQDTSVAIAQIKEMMDMVPKELPAARDDTWVIQTKEGINSSAFMLYRNLLDYVAEKVEDDIYIVPVGSDELLVVSVRTGRLSELENSLKEMNTMITTIEDRLSNNVYLYDRETKKIRIVSKNKQSRLDNNVFFIKI